MNFGKRLVENTPAIVLGFDARALESPHRIRDGASAGTR
jgi:hypothetical protein